MKDMTGQRFNRLVVSKFVSLDSSGRSRWSCTCDCGGSKVVRRDALMSGSVQSCGCLASEITSARSVTHGQSKTQTYRCWQMMVQRCCNPQQQAYPDYGGRGIQVCERWMKFDNFLADMGEMPEGKSLDRFPNNDGNYEPGNCRWATRKEQLANRRNTLFVHVDGVPVPMSDYAASIGKRQSTVWRWYKNGVLPYPVTKGAKQNEKGSGN